MAASFEAIDFDTDRIAWVAFDIDLWRSTRRTAWPASTRFEPRLLVRGLARIVHLVRRLASERFVRTVLVVPIVDEREFPLELRLIFRNKKQH